ncbi:hypothetical protein LCGC14_2192080, partial [marine sediment metagenome]
MRNVLESMSDRERRDLLQGALADLFPHSHDDGLWTWIEEMWPEKMVYRRGEDLFEVTYDIDDEKKVSMGVPVEVTAVRVYRPIESLQRVYSNLIYELGKRNASADKKRINAIIALSKELLSSEPADAEE